MASQGLLFYMTAKLDNAISVDTISNRDSLRAGRKIRDWRLIIFDDCNRPSTSNMIA